MPVMVERIIPSELDGDELWQRNGVYVDVHSYDAAVARIAELEAAMRVIEARGCGSGDQWCGCKAVARSALQAET